MSNREYLFETPNSPEEFGVVLVSPDLRRIDFSALDYDRMQRAAIEYIKTYYPNNFNDFVASNGFMMIVELVCYLANVLSQRSDILADESFLPTSQTTEAVINHLSLINQQLQRATPATVDIEITFNSPVPVEVKIPSGVKFSFTGPDGDPVFYEVFRAPGDFTNPISIPPNKRGIIAYGIEGNTPSPVVYNSSGGPDQYIDITTVNVLDAPITVDVKSGNDTVRWDRVDILEKADPNDDVYEVLYLGSKTRIKFGNDLAGKAPLAGDEITVGYRVGGGVRGRIGAGTINETRAVTPLPPLSASVEALFRNPSPSQGGTDEETIDHAKRRAPAEFATHDSIVTGADYGTLAENYSHPVYGSVAKALGTIRTGIDQDLNTIAENIRSAPSVEVAVEIMRNDFINRNIVEVYVLAEGPNNVPITPNSGLKQGLVTFFSNLNVLTDEVRVLDGKIKFVDVQATIIIDRNADAGTVKINVQNAINTFFDIDSFGFGTPLYLSNLYKDIQDVDGVKYVNIYSPNNDIIPTDNMSASSSGSVESADRVAFNEVIALGDVDLKFYFEQGNFKVPPVGAKGSIL